ncbi:MFS transporter [Nocardia sp. NPDC004604]|uniref:MFS transporter n=1 Tax=Nocardia sp. NPDC004604 TaxID=3157013 RepID=UPI0033A395DB
MLALILPAQLLTISGIAGGASQPHIVEFFRTGHIVWFNLATLLVSLFSLPFAVKFGEIYGKRRVMLILAAAGIVGDVISALAPSFVVLLIGRAIAGFYGPIVALVPACIRDCFPAKRVAMAYGVVMGSVGVVVLVSPVVVGNLIDSFGWRGAMWLLTGLTVIAIGMLAVMPETPRRGRFGSEFDWAGGLLLGIGVALVAYGGGNIYSLGWGASRTVWPLLVGLLALAAFVPVELTTTSPIVDLRMLAQRPVAVVIITTAFVQFAFIISPLIFSFLAQYPRIPLASDGFGWTATHYALVGIPAGAATVGAAVVTGVLLKHVEPRPLWLIGAALLVLGLLLFGQYHRDTAQIVVSSMVVGLAGGIVMACGTAMVVSVVTAEEQATVNGIAYMALQVIGGFGYQVLFTVLAAHQVVMQGVPFYRDAGYADAYRLLAGLAGVGLLAALLLPRIRRPSDALVN